jgi:hypothetical protein
MAAVLTWETRKWGYIDKTGNMAIRPQFDDAAWFSEGLAAVRTGDPKTGKWGYIDPAGNMVIQPQFAWGGKFSEGLADVRIGDKYGFVDRTGSMVIQPQFVFPGLGVRKSRGQVGLH